ncbi:MAG: endonuclease/exonuclease/phosphatase family protein [Chthonomonas sp.]|nr:endonuclease/exonuclease/phosphatase family protein [Chthonomonas sp.]
MKAAVSPVRSRKQVRRPRVVTWLYAWAALVLLIWGVSAAGNDRAWWGTALASVPPQVWLIPTALLLVIGVAGKNLRLIWVPLVACALVHLGQMGFRWALVTGSSMPELKVLTWNLRHGERGMNSIVAELRRIDADVLLLQETHQGELGDSPFQVLREKLPEYNFVGGEETMILSKLPIRESRVNELPLASHRRFVPQAEIEFEGKVVTLYSVHLLNGLRPDWLKGPSGLPRKLDHAEKQRWDQIKAVDGAIRAEGPVIIGGDFNTLPRGAIYQHFADRYTDAFAAAGRGLGWTFPDYFLTARIDYLWSSPELVPVEANVVGARASDHLPVLAKYILKK